MLLAVPLALLALAPLAGRAAAPVIGKSSGPAVDLTLHYHSTLTGLRKPARMATDTHGNLYVSDLNRDRVLLFDANDQFVRYFGSGTVGTGGGNFNDPQGIAFSGNTVFVADNGNHQIQTFNQSTGAFISQFGASHLASAIGLAQDSNGTLYVVDNLNSAIAEFSISGAYLGQIGRFGRFGSGDGQFIFPAGIASDGTHLHVADTGNARIEVFDTSGTYQYQFGSYGGSNGQFRFPQGIAVDITRQELFITDNGNNRVQVYTTSGQFIASLTSAACLAGHARWERSAACPQPHTHAGPPGYHQATDSRHPAPRHLTVTRSERKKHAAPIGTACRERCALRAELPDLMTGLARDAGWLCASYRLVSPMTANMGASLT